MNSVRPEVARLVAIPDQGRILRKLFLTLFLRGRTSRGLRKDKAPRSLPRKLALALLFYALYGLFAFFFVNQGVLLLSIYLHAMTFMFLGMFVASSAGEVLFNQAEADILLHRPVQPKAMLWAKISMLVQVSIWLALALNLAGLFVGAMSPQGSWVYPFAHVVSTVVEALFTTGCFVLVYQLCLRWLGRERLDGIMTTAQTFITILFIMGGQLLPRLMGSGRNLSNLALDNWWLALLPPMWFASFDHALTTPSSTYSWAVAGVGLLATAMVLGVAFGKLAGSYESGLQRLGETSAKPPRGRRRSWIVTAIRLPGLNRWLGEPVTRASFLLTTAYMFRDREVRLRLYPGIAPILILPILFLLQGSARDRGDVGGTSFGLAMSGSYLGLIPLLALNILQYSQHWLAADVYRLAPLRGPGAICHGARKAVLIFLTLPLVLLTFLVSVAVGATPTQLLLLLPGIMTIPLFSMIPGLLGRNVPLSHPPEDAKAANRGLIMIGMIFVAMFIAALASFARHAGLLLPFLGVELLIVAGLYWLGRRRFNHLRWRPLE